MTLTTCTTDGCVQLVLDGPRCPRCERARQAMRDAGRGGPGLRCADCGAPQLPTGRARADREWYMVTDETWRAARMPPRGFLCTRDLERRLARALVAADLTDDPINAPGNDADLPYLAGLKAAAALARARGSSVG